MKKVRLEIYYSSGEPLGYKLIDKLTRDGIPFKATDFREVICWNQDKNSKILKMIKQSHVTKFPVVIIDNKVMAFDTDSHVVLENEIKERMKE